MSQRRYRFIRTKRSGLAYIGLCIALGVIAVNSGNNLLYLTTAVMLGYMLASGIAGRRNIRSVKVNLDFPDEIYAQTPCETTVKLTNTNSFLPIYLLNVTLWDAYGTESSSVLFPILQPGETATKTLFISFKQRGVSIVDDLELSSVYPFDFFERFWPSKFKTEVVVFPHRLRCETSDIFAETKSTNQNSMLSPSPLSDSDTVGIRPYTEGDPMKRVHWKSSAKTGQLKSRIYETSRGNAHILDTNRLLEKGKERGLSEASFIISETLKTGDPIGMCLGKEIMLPSSEKKHKIELLTRLALYAD